MGLVLGSDLDPQQLAERVAATAAGKIHKLRDFQVDGRHPLTPAAADGIMNYLARCPDKITPEQPVAPQKPEVPAVRSFISDIAKGCYATASRTGANDLDFWKVSVSKSGFRSVKRVIGGGSDDYPALVDISQGEQKAALSAILRAGIQEASELFADKLKRCRKCGRALTDEESRAAKMGPVCRGKSE